jgi:hypothetical protein
MGTRANNYFVQFYSTNFTIEQICKHFASALLYFKDYYKVRISKCWVLRGPCHTNSGLEWNDLMLVVVPVFLLLGQKWLNPKILIGFRNPVFTPYYHYPDYYSIPSHRALPLQVGIYIRESTVFHINHQKTLLLFLLKISQEIWKLSELWQTKDWK